MHKCVTFIDDSRDVKEKKNNACNVCPLSLVNGSVSWRGTSVRTKVMRCLDTVTIVSKIYDMVTYSDGVVDCSEIINEHNHSFIHQVIFNNGV